MRDFIVTVMLPVQTTQARSPEQALSDVALLLGTIFQNNNRLVMGETPTGAVAISITRGSFSSGFIVTKIEPVTPDHRL